MRIESVGKWSYLDIVAVDLEREYCPSMQLTIELLDIGTFGKVRASIRDAYIDLESYATFLRELDACESERRGRTALSAMNPGEVDIAIEFVGALGIPTLVYDLSTTTQIYGGLREIRVTGAFDIDPSMMANIISELRELSMTE